MNAIEQMYQTLERIASNDYAGNSKIAARAAIQAYNTAKEREEQDEKCMLHSERIKYNGWANYETWAIALELSNDAGSYDTCTELVRSAGSVYGGATALREYYESLIDDVLSGWTTENYMGKKRHMEVSDIPFYGLYTAALSAVDWYEVARSFKPDEWGDSDSAPEDTEEEDTDE